jgi:hypothetical protein
MEERGGKMLTLIALLAAIGMSHIIVDGSVLARWRGKMVVKYKDTRPWVVELISCYQCTGFWTGAFTGLALQPITWGLFSYFTWWLALILSIPLWLVITPFIFGCAASYLSMAGAGLLNWLDAPALMAHAMKKQNEPKA